MSRELIVQIGNELIQRKGNLGAWLELISEYVNYKDKSKTDTILKAFPSLPQEIQVKCVMVALEHFGKEFNVCVLHVVDSNPNFIVNGKPQEILKPIYYF